MGMIDMVPPARMLILRTSSNHHPPPQALTFEAVEYLISLSVPTSTASSVKYEFHAISLDNKELFAASFDVWHHNAFNSASASS
jgi:hypothetical protein